ncbi:MAG TPA: hypothetical protein VJK48_05210 [Chlamydiales bacterium]|nr:hypothetical protein [Chlamydiales bacterium]
MQIPQTFRLFNSKELLTLFWLFLLIFPKGGIKLLNVPITWGYVFLGIATLLVVRKGIFIYHTPRLYALFCTIPFQLVVLGTLIFLKVEEYGPSISLLLNFVFFPWIFSLLFSNFFETLDIEHLFSLLKKGIFVISLYGVFLFFFKFFTGNFLEIPFVTVNFHDLGNLEGKHIDRGTFFKLISTYNNGNIYGICLLMLLPLYLFLEQTRWKKGIVFLSLLLTFSRTVWVGSLFSFFITALFASQKRSLLRSLLIGGIAISIIFIATYLSGFTLSFLFDTALGGRIEQFEIVKVATFFPNAPFREILEIVYLSILASFGIVGLATYLLSMIGPIVIAYNTFPLCIVRRRILCGLVNFLFVSFSDGALLLIPVLAFYWILSSLALRKTYATILVNGRAPPS